eukprot:5820726-Karenia_brevis.AAC.1
MACKLGDLNNATFFNSSPTIAKFWITSAGRFVTQMSCVQRIAFLLVSCSSARYYCTGRTGL